MCRYYLSDLAVFCIFRFVMATRDPAPSETTKIGEMAAREKQAYQEKEKEQMAWMSAESVAVLVGGRVREDQGKMAL